jgi:hypothetical protein
MHAAALALTLCLLLSTSRGAASPLAVPDPSQCTVESPMVGNHTGNTMAGIGSPGYGMVVRDVLGMGISGSTVSLDFSSAPGIRLYSTQNPGTTVNCAARTLSRMTNANGQATFGPRFGGFVNSNSVEVYADGVLLAYVAARSTDLDGSAGTTDVADLSLFKNELYKMPPEIAEPQTDFNNDGQTNVADLALFRIELFTPIVGAYCP